MFTNSTLIQKLLIVVFPQLSLCVAHLSPITYITPHHNKHRTTLIPMPKTKKAAPTRLGTSPQRASSRIASLQSPPRRILSGLAASDKRRASKGTSASRGVNRGPDFPFVSSPSNCQGTPARGIAEVGSVSVLVCDWARVGLCQIVGAAGPTLVRCQFGGGCDCVLHHLCQTEWESKDETGDREAHGIRKLCALHHPALRLFDVTPQACSAVAIHGRAQ